MKVFTFLFINFVVAFISDIILNDLSTKYGMITSLKPYFNNQSIIKSGIYAGITIEFALITTILLFFSIFGFFLPINRKTLLYFCILAFIVGYAMDVSINNFKIFGNRLDKYYKEMGSGFWGAISLLFSILISYFIQKQILPIL